MFYLKKWNSLCLHFLILSCSSFSKRWDILLRKEGLNDLSDAILKIKFVRPVVAPKEVLAITLKQAQRLHRSCKRIGKRAHIPASTAKLYMAMHKNGGFQRNALWSQIRKLLTNFWCRLTLALFDLGIVLQPERVGGRGRGGAVLVLLRHCPVRGRGSHFFPVVSVNHDVAVDVCSHTDILILLFVFMPFSGDGHGSPCRMMPCGPWGFIILFI